MGFLSADELLAGGALTHDVAVPAELLESETADPARVRLRPLTVRDVQLVTKAARDDDALLSALMLKTALVQPEMTLDQVQGLSAGLARYLIDEVNRVSGLVVAGDELHDAVEAPLARACFVLAREFGWTPEEIGALTMGQILLYVEMVGRNASVQAAV
jgi:hypothetical protein